MKRTAVTVTIALCVSACAVKAPLEPAAGEALPTAPYGAEYTPDSEELLEPTVTAVPARDIELRERSEEREDDPFDLPPQ